jgi:putative flippase GtrA
MNAPRKAWIAAIHRANVSQFTRFLGAGLVNTGVGYGVYLVLLNWINYQIAYAAAYVVGIVFAYTLNSLFVFRSPIGLRTAVRYPFVYLAQYLFGAALLYGMVNWLGIDRRWAAVLALALSVPVSFVLNRIALTYRASSS